MVKLPEEPMMPRLHDERVGYFSVRKTDFGTDTLTVLTFNCVLDGRWRVMVFDCCLDFLVFVLTVAAVLHDSDVVFADSCCCCCC